MKLRLSRKRFIKTAAGLVLPAWACSGQVVIPGAIMRTIPAAGGCSTLRDSETTVDTFDNVFDRYFASIFRAGANYSLCKVDVSIARNASEDSDLLITIRTNNAGEPSTTVVGTSDTVLNANIPTDFEFVSFTFPSPPALTSGTDYWIVITRADNADGLQIYWEMDNNATVEGMERAAAAAPTTWTTVAASAVGVFKTYSE